jgi:stage V sporulation protein K
MSKQFANYGSHEKGTSHQENSRSSLPSSERFSDYSTGNDQAQVQSQGSSRKIADENSQPEQAIATENSEAAKPKLESIEELLSELDSLIGLQRVKEEVRRLLHYVRVQEMRKDRGISNTRMTLHSVFYGSPGTGKTTVARIYGRMLKSLGLLETGHLIETDRSGLVANYVGQTAGKTSDKIEEALGGVLFIDEAYSLSRGDRAEWDYGSEAIEILMKKMEDHRDEFVVIVAGYPEPMQKFLRSNEGFKSRFSTYVRFDDFSPEEMLQIFSRFCLQENYEIQNEALEMVFSAIDYNYSLRDESFGNARFVRNLFEVVIKNHAMRVSSSHESPTIDDLKLILPQDIPLTTDSGTENS